MVHQYLLHHRPLGHSRSPQTHLFLCFMLNSIYLSLCVNVLFSLGETSAGKSSVINLILGEEILPNAVLSTTATIFELKYGEKPMIGLHFKSNEGSRDPMYYELTGSKETYEQQITNLAGQKKGRGKVSPYKKVEIFWPHPLFQVILCVYCLFFIEGLNGDTSITLNT